MGDVSAHWGWVGNIKVKSEGFDDNHGGSEFLRGFTDDSYEGFAVERLMPDSSPLSTKPTPTQDP